MIKDSSALYVGVANFSEPVLLLFGNENSIRWLASMINRRQKFTFSEMAKHVRMFGVDVQLIPVESNSRLVRSGNAFTWEVSFDDAAKFVGLLCMLAESEVPGHAYLDPKENFAEIPIVASKDEYHSIRIFGV